MSILGLSKEKAAINKNIEEQTFTSSVKWFFISLQSLYQAVASYLEPKQTLKLDYYKIEREDSVVLASVKKVDDYAVKRLGGDSTKNKSTGLTKLDYLKLAVVGAGLAVASTDESSLATTVAAGASFLSVWALSINRAFILPMASAQDINNSTYPNLVFYIDQPNSFSMPLKDIFGVDNIIFNQVLDSDNSTSPIDFSFILGAYNTPGNVQDVFVSANLAYLATQSSGLQIVDVKDPTLPVFKGTCLMREFAFGVAISGNLAYVANGVDGLQIVDISNPSLPSIKGGYNTKGSALGVVVAENLAYIAGDTAGLQIIDVSNPELPVLKGSFDTPGKSSRIVFSGNLVYLADGNAGLQIIDVSNPEAPTLKGNYSTSGTANGVALRGDLLFVADTDGLQILDVSNPAFPRLKGNYNTPGQASSVALQGDLAFVGTSAGGIQIIDVSNPLLPIFKEAYEVPKYPYNVGVIGNVVYVADTGLQIFDFSILRLTKTPTLQNRGIYSLKITGSRGSSVFSSGFKMVVSEQISIKSNKPSEAILLSGYGKIFETSFYPVELFRYYGVIAFLNFKLRDDPLIPGWLTVKKSAVVTSNYNALGIAKAVAVSKNLAYMADWGFGLQIIDVSNPALPRLKGMYKGAATAWNVIVIENLAYVLDVYNGLQIVDVTNPDRPVLKGNYTIAENSAGIALKGNLAYVVGGTGLRIINVTNPAFPTLEGIYSKVKGPVSIALSGNFAYLADGSAGLQIIDVSNPALPTLKGKYSTVESYSIVVAVRDEIVYLADKMLGLQIIDVSNPALPTLKGRYAIAGNSYGLTLNGALAYVVGDFGLQIIDVSNPFFPGLKETYDTPGTSSGVALSGNLAYIADGQSGLHIIDFSKNYYTLSGIPSAGVAGNYEFQITAFNDLGISKDSPYSLRVEGAPLINSTMDPQVAFVGEIYNAIVKQGVFVDPNEDALTFSATLANGMALPSWLQFSPTGIFLGIPKSSAIGVDVVRIKADDGHAGTAFIDVPLTVTNAPLLANPISDQTFNVGQNFSFTFPSNTFIDLDGDVMNYTASKANSLPLPDWIVFNGDTRKFSGISWNTSRVSIDLEATEIHGGKAHAYFDLIIAVIVNRPPLLMVRMSDKVIDVLENFQFSLPTDMFKDPDGDPITLTATMEDGTPMPSWIKFDAIEKAFSGRASRSETNNFTPRDYHFAVVASDGDKITESTFRLQVEGDSDLARGLKMAGYALSVFSTLFAVYKQRARIWKVIGRRSYNAPPVKAAIGEHFRYQLSESAVSCFVKRLDKQEVFVDEFFGDEIKFNSKNNCIEGVPSLVNRGEYTIVAYNKFGVLSRVFTLDIDPDEGEMLLYSREEIPLRA